MEKAYYEDQITYYKNAINKHDKFLYWLKKRIEEDERGIENNYMVLPSMNYHLVNQSKSTFFKVIKTFLKSFIP